MTADEQTNAAAEWMRKAARSGVGRPAVRDDLAALVEQEMVGRRVMVHLPNRENRGRWEWVVGTVKATNEPGRPRGVRVRFDSPFNGGDDCLATIGELRPAPEDAR